MRQISLCSLRTIPFTEIIRYGGRKWTRVFLLTLWRKSFLLHWDSGDQGAAVAGHTVTHVSESLYKWPPGECWNNLMVNVSGMQRRHTDESTSPKLGHSSCRNTGRLRRSDWEAEPGRAASASLLHLPQSIGGHPSLVSLLSALDSFSKCSESS